jgi:3-hydroxy-9,10-secoandrosta-1,3,5(10)-triene-9,17-dione monooxygenase reductase component
MSARRRAESDSPYPAERTGDGANGAHPGNGVQPGNGAAHLGNGAHRSERSYESRFLLPDTSASSARHAAAPDADASPTPTTPVSTVPPVPERPESTGFRTVMGTFATGVTIITALDDASPLGFTCQTFTSLSLDPPLISFAVSRESGSRPRILAAGRFCVNILAFDQRGLCSRFATPGVDRFEGVSWWHSPGGSPILDGVLAWVDCAVEAEYPAGDHTIVIGRVEDLEHLRDAGPLVYHRGGFANCFPVAGSGALPRVG